MNNIQVEIKQILQQENPHIDILLPQEQNIIASEALNIIKIKQQICLQQHNGDDQAVSEQDFNSVREVYNQNQNLSNEDWEDVENSNKIGEQSIQQEQNQQPQQNQDQQQENQEQGGIHPINQVQQQQQININQFDDGGLEIIISVVDFIHQDQNQQITLIKDRYCVMRGALVQKCLSTMVNSSKILTTIILLSRANRQCENTYLLLYVFLTLLYDMVCLIQHLYIFKYLLQGDCYRLSVLVENGATPDLNLNHLEFSIDDYANPQYHDNSCCICYGEYIENESIVKLPCRGKHIFHQECVIPWLRKKGDCPYCRDQFGELMIQEEAQQ